ncbi:DUF177 domain-containing protein [Cognatishimia sp. F0-27]|uniref:YceD family protein n=1 Tax=Cognatishimia sp. F0-27 TaxID=2816855 RepID=UPI001D0BFE84|nr:DUF177 domain-containing protein [Cognatishimia sp. F0-27]MCC1494401.1 DUF177 domain-containing protein [Cognatishimia sp. F0-27]
MPASPAPSTVLPVARLSQSGPTRFSLEPDAQTRAALASTLGISALRKLRFAGTITAKGRRAFELQADLGVTVVQPCVVTLASVTTRIDMPVLRRFVPEEDLVPETTEAGAEVEMPEDDTLEPLGAQIDLEAVMTEAISLALPSYPRAEGATLEPVQVAEDGVVPLTDDDVKPFAGLAALRDKLGGGSSGD